ncbi:hypothetical protein CPB83DRAFT_861089 [Crepidotus variabilis]|uniref:Nephrocystin 3-like N-terminal domain-containing protein n=1 Tax=Crepidotus variabilis TaxID=179855 RepID=A0A9P6JLC2_9AGAR|nr:hypothetical protein CPB83DRAFT_861089 [Crepidotus variabilis]
MSSFFKGASNFVVEGGSFVINDSGTLKRLYKRTAPSAIHTYEHDGFDQPKCQEGTREAIFRRLKGWILGLMDSGEYIMWLYGAAGAGKSAIALEFARRCSSEDLLLADFFFSGSDPARATLKSFVATIALQIAQTLPAIQTLLEEVIQTNPGIFDQLFEAQFEQLISTPLRRHFTSNSRSQPLLLIVDGLDECRDHAAQERLLATLGCFSDNMKDLGIPIRILIASRSEHHLTMKFNSSRWSSGLARLALNNEQSTNADIQRFIMKKFDEIRESYPTISSSWPSSENISLLVKKSSGQFIYAKLATQFLVSGRYGPCRALEMVLGVHPTIKSKLLPFSELDAFYLYLLSLFEDTQLTKLILGVRLITSVAIPRHKMRDSRPMAGPHPLTTIGGIAGVLGTDPTDVSCLFYNLSSIIDCFPDGYTRVQHASLLDFLQDPTRAGEYYIDSLRLHTDLAVRCLEHLSRNDNEDATYMADQLFGPIFDLAPGSPELQEAIARFSFNQLRETTRLNNRRFWRHVSLVYKEHLPKLDSIHPNFRLSLHHSLDQYICEDFSPEPWFSLAFAMSMNGNGQEWLSSTDGLSSLAQILTVLLDDEKRQIVGDERLIDILSFFSSGHMEYFKVFLQNNVEKDQRDPTLSYDTVAIQCLKYLIEIHFFDGDTLPTYLAPITCLGHLLRSCGQPGKTDCALGVNPLATYIGTEICQYLDNLTSIQLKECDDLIIDDFFKNLKAYLESCLLSDDPIRSEFDRVSSKVRQNLQLPIPVESSQSSDTEEDGWMLFANVVETMRMLDDGEVPDPRASIDQVSRAFKYIP